jgi:hypothetical protein
LNELKTKHINKKIIMKQTTYSDGQVFFLVVLRMAIGWFILYQGLVKYFDPSWSAAGYLLSSK